MQAAVVALGTVHVSDHSAGVTGDRRHAGEAGQAIGRPEARHVTRGGGQELRAEQDPHPGQAAGHLGGRTAANPALDELVDLPGLPVEGQHPLRQVGDQAGGQLLTRQPDRLGSGRATAAAASLAAPRTLRERSQASRPATPCARSAAGV